MDVADPAVGVLAPVAEFGWVPGVVDEDLDIDVDAVVHGGDDTRLRRQADTVARGVAPVKRAAGAVEPNLVPGMAWAKARGPG